ncbi:MAG TPA: hypothetical protein GX734_02640 [Clostridiaceae bacterium]|nr:hypothetical protein [Clostridiaceae bacterium]
MDDNRHKKHTRERTLFQFLQLNKWSILIASMAVASILIGLFRVSGDEVKILLKKAINICMECIGIG